MALEDQTLREAFQIHDRVVPWDARARLLAELAGAGIKRLQIGSVARPDRMPQMAGVERLLETAAAFPVLEPWVLVFNSKGLERASAAGFKHVALTASLSEPHSRRNLACPVKQGLARCRRMADQALNAGLTVRMGLQCAFGGPMRSLPRPEELAAVLAPFHELGVRRLALCDTAGRAQALSLVHILTALRGELPGSELGLHLHGGRQNLAQNLEAAWQGGADWLDATLEGRGGCPFLPGQPPGNLPLLEAAEFIRQKGLEPGLDPDRLRKAADLLDRILAGLLAAEAN